MTCIIRGCYNILMNNDSPIYYLDHAAATPCRQEVVEAMVPYLSEKFYNPSSPYAPAVEVRREYEAAKHRIAMAIGARPTDVTLTAGATESINLAMTAAHANHIVTTAIEHAAVLESARQYDHTLVEVSAQGLVASATVAAALRADTRLVSIGLANNEIGTIQSLRAIADIIQQERDKRLKASNATPIWLHSDASQGVGQIDINIARLGVDMLTLNAGKCYGPKQTALLWHRPDVKLQPLVVGGGQENGLRSGTENVAGVIGFATALELAEKDRKHEAHRLSDLRDHLQAKLEAAFPDMLVSGHPKKRLPGSLHVVFPGLDAERLVFALEMRGVLVATGSACAANSGTRSHVLTAVGMTNEQADGSLRLTLGRLNDEPSIDEAVTIMIEEITREMERTR